jgi:NADPH:quinone reductase-like Zn-dependent oxidoreductase
MKPGDGSLAELCAVPDVDVVPIVAAVPDALAAALGLSGVAAWMALSWRARLAAAERVLVLGGGGAVGQAGIGVAHVLDAAEVIALARPSSVSRAQAAGADVVLPLDTTDVDALAASLAVHGPYDVILDPVFGVPATAAARELAVGGRLVNLGGASGDTAEFSSASLRSKTASVLGYTNNALDPEQRREALTSVLEHAAAGHIRIHFEECPLRDVESTWSHVVAGTAGSRRVLLP